MSERKIDVTASGSIQIHIKLQGSKLVALDLSITFNNSNMFIWQLDLLVNFQINIL